MTRAGQCMTGNSRSRLAGSVTSITHWVPWLASFNVMNVLWCSQRPGISRYAWRIEFRFKLLLGRYCWWPNRETKCCVTNRKVSPCGWLERNTGQRQSFFVWWWVKSRTRLEYATQSRWLWACVSGATVWFWAACRLLTLRRKQWRETWWRSTMWQLLGGMLMSAIRRAHSERQIRIFTGNQATNDLALTWRDLMAFPLITYCIRWPCTTGLRLRECDSFRSWYRWLLCRRSIWVSGIQNAIITVVIACCIQGASDSRRLAIAMGVVGGGHFNVLHGRVSLQGNK